MMTKKKLIHASLWLALANVVSCKPANNADVARMKTLDSIASGVIDIEANQCKGNAPSSLQDSKIVFDKTDPKKLTESEKMKVRQAVKDYFSALPPSAEALFLKMGGQVMISSKADQLCSTAHYGRNLDASQGEVTEGCFHFVNDPTGKKSPIFTIVHAPNPNKIRYYGPQIFGYIYAQFYSRLTLSANRKGLTIADKEPMQLVSHKEKIANAFLADILSSKDFKIDALKNLLGENSASELSSPTNSSPLDKLSSMKNEQRRSQFLDYVYANSFQSAHCNSHSLTVAKNKFKKSSALFADIDLAVLEVSQTLLGQSHTASMKSTASDNSGFSLAGENILSTVMPLLGNLQGLIGGGGADLNGISSLFSSLTSGGGGGAIQQVLGSGLQNVFGDLFSSLSAGGCDSGGCSGCGGSCSGGSCSNCANGSCGGCSGGVCTCS